MRKQTLVVLLIGIVVGMVVTASVVFGISVPSTPSNPVGYTPVGIRVPREGAEIHKTASLVIITERLTDVCCVGPAEIEFCIKTIGPNAELIASGSVDVLLLP